MEIDFFTFLRNLLQEPKFNSFVSEMERITNVDYNNIFLFIFSYFYKQDSFSFNKDRFDVLWNNWIKEIKRALVEKFIRIPLFNFYLLKKELSRDNITCRLVDFEKNEHYYALIQLLGEQPLENYGLATKNIGFNSKPGILSSHFFEISYLYTKKEEIQFELEKTKAILSGSVEMEGGYTFSQEKLVELQTFCNPRIQELVDSTRQIELYLEIALQIFKKGDVCVFGILRGGTFQNINLKRALCTLEKKYLSKLQVPYSLTPEEFLNFKYLIV
ncbi:MAG: hypothetical protein ACTSX6_14070 [Candidatus Heimdallarchaeaceae archaeon]